MDFEDQLQIARFGWEEQRQMRQADREHELDRDAAYGAAKLLIVERWTNCVVFVAILGFAASLIAIFHG